MKSRCQPRLLTVHIDPLPALSLVPLGPYLARIAWDTTESNTIRTIKKIKKMKKISKINKINKMSKMNKINNDK